MIRKGSVYAVSPHLRCPLSVLERHTPIPPDTGRDGRVMTQATAQANGLALCKVRPHSGRSLVGGSQIPQLHYQSAFPRSRSGCKLVHHGAASTLGRPLIWLR
jgi:hypothetical protein